MSSYLQTFLCGLLFCRVFLAVSEVQMFAAVEKFEYLYYIGYMLLFIRMPKSAAGSAPSLPSYSTGMSPTGRCMRSPASLPPLICRQSSASGVQRSPSPNTRHRSLTVQGHGMTKQQARPAVGRIGRAPSTPAFSAVQRSSTAPVTKVMHGVTKSLSSVRCYHILSPKIWGFPVCM